MLNRSALILRYKQPFVDWINAADPIPTNHRISLEDTNQERTVYLVTAEDHRQFDRWLRANAQLLFEAELSGWYTDPKLWPKRRSLGVLKEWCSFELMSVVIDTGGPPLFDDGLE